jgi:hypothetical protein
VCGKVVAVSLSSLEARREIPGRARFGLYDGLAVVGLASVVTPLVPSPFRAILGLVVVLVVPGTAVTSSLNLGSILSETLLAVAISAAITVVGGYGMLAAHAWEPIPWAVAVGTASGAVLAIKRWWLHLERGRMVVGGAGSKSRDGSAQPRQLPSLGRIYRRWRLDGAVPSLCVVGLVLWSVALPSINPASATDSGLIGKFPLTFFLAVAALVIAFGLALHRSRPQHLAVELAVLTGLLVVVLYATTPLIAALPRYTYVYKHLGVAGYLNLHGATQPSLDIYQNWPGFFALIAVLERVGNISGVSLALWGQLAFALADALAVRYALRGLSHDDRVVGLATWLYVLFDWVGQNYLSPEAFGFTVAVTGVGVALHHLSIQGDAYRGPRPLRRVAGRSVTAGPPEPEGRRVPRRAALGVILLLSASVAVSHQLSPLILSAFVAVLLLVRRIQGWWLLVAIAALTAAQFLRAYPYLEAHHLLFSGLANFIANAAGTSGSLPGSSGHLLVEHAARVLSIGVWLGAVVAFAVQRRRGSWELPAAGLFVVPFGLLGLQSYGGEAIYRVFLFTTPWSAYLIASALVGGRRSTVIGRGRNSALSRGFHDRGAAWAVVASSLLVPLWLTSFYGLYRSDYVRPSELAAWNWFASHASAKSVLDEVCNNFPVGATGDYNLYGTVNGLGGTAIVSQRAFEGRSLSAKDVPAAIALLRAYAPGRPVYVVLSAGQEAYAEAFGFSPPGSVARFEAILAQDASFRTVFHQGSTRLLELKSTARDVKGPG